MTPNSRLVAIGVVIVMSAGYAVVVKTDVKTAYALALGYIAIVLTIFLLISCWKKPPHDKTRS